MSSCKQEIVTVRGRNIRVYRGGAGPPLLFLHDPFCPLWLPLHEKLAAHHEIFVPIHPGFAGSEDNFEQFEEMEDLIFHYLDFCEVFGLDRPSLAGASFGGWIAAEWAVRYGHTLEKLILIDPLGLRVADAPAADILSLDAAAMRRTLFSDPTSSVALETIPDTPKAEAMISTILARRAFARFGWQFPDDPRLLRYLYRVKVPTMIIWGEQDGYVPLSHGRAYHQGIAAAQLKIVSHVGHLPHVETAAVCADIMIDFLRR